MTVVDRDYGYERIIKSLYELDGLAAWVGVLSGKEKYPDKVSVAKVAAIWQAKGQWMSATIDKRSATFSAEFQEARYKVLMQGMNPVDALEDVAEQVRKDLVAELRAQGLFKTGRLIDSVKYRVGVASNRGRSGQQPSWSKILREGP